MHYKKRCIKLTHSATQHLARSFDNIYFYKTESSYVVAMS